MPVQVGGQPGPNGGVSTTLFTEPCDCGEQQRWGPSLNQEGLQVPTCVLGSLGVCGLSGPWAVPWAPVVCVSQVCVSLCGSLGSLLSCPLGV